ncbi:hypothetical protein ACK03K_34310 [[Kitasatospora] papulosa]|uniref:hypothetical protein n=1 Tax=[Kitasatospora] papulosa TaxID=1464011 RepID=UPI0039083A8D
MPDHDAVYRAVITWTEAPQGGGAAHTEYEGPYGKPGAAQGRVTAWENDLRDHETGETRATGHVERSTTTWEPYTPPVKKERRRK